MGTTLAKQGKRKYDEEVPTFKIVLVGEPCSGKSSIFLRYTKNQFDYSYQPSVSVSIGNVVRKINIPYQGVVSVVIWDVPGREEMDLRKSYYKDVDAAIVVVDVSEAETIDLAPTWKQDVLNHAQIPMNTVGVKDQSCEEMPVLLLGNKVDKLESSKEDDQNSSSSYETKELQALEETAVKHGFVGSVAVSAKEGDGSVQAAIQTLVRYLLQRRAPEKITQENTRDIFKLSRKMSKDVDNERPFMPFLKVHVKEFDEVFQSSEEPLKVIEKCGQTYVEALRIFKKSCYVADLTHSYKSSLEECITGLKQSMVDENNKCALQAIDDGGFLNLVILEDIIDDISGPVNKILRIFHTKVAVAAKNVLAKCSVAHNKLQYAQGQLNELCSSFSQLANDAGLSDKARRKAWVDTEANRTRLAESCTTTMELLQTVEIDCKKIRAAVLW